jgi:hypothetical protein
MTLEPSHYEEIVGPPPGDAAQPATDQTPPPRGPSREYRASITFTIGGAFALLALFLFGGAFSLTPAVLGVLILASVLLGMVAQFATAYGLAGGRAWAIAVMTPLLWLLVIEGAIQFIQSLLQGSLNIPIGALLAMWALRAPIRHLPVRAWGGRGTAVFLASIVSAVLPWFAPALLVAGGPLIVAQDALRPILSVECQGTPGHAPTRIHVEYEWSWTRGEPWVDGTDTIEIGSFTQAAEEDFSYVLEHTDDGSNGTWQSNVQIGDAPRVLFGVDLSQARFEPGRVGVWLLPSSENPSDDGSIDIGATYRHGASSTQWPGATDVSGFGDAGTLAAWEVDTAARCEW